MPEKFEIHQSHLNTAFKCGQQFYRRYIRKEIIPPGIAAGRGTAVHKANEVNMRQKIDTGEDLPISVLLDVSRDGFQKVFKDGIFLAPEDVPAKTRILNSGLNDALELTKLYRKEVAPKLNPTHVEHSFNIELPSIKYPLSGRIDMFDKNGIHDLKTAGRNWSAGKISSEIQPIFYSLAYQIMTGTASRFSYYIMVKTPKKAETTIQTIQAQKTDYAILLEQIKIFIKMLDSGVFPPANRAISWACSPKWCGYYTTCKYVGGK